VYERDGEGPDALEAGGRHFNHHFVWMQNLIWYMMAKTEAQGARDGAPRKIFSTKRGNKKEGRKKTLSLSEGKSPLGRPRRRRQDKIKTDSE
jgi:hypothetical protein